MYHTTQVSERELQLKALFLNRLFAIIPYNTPAKNQITLNRTFKTSSVLKPQNGKGVYNINKVII